MKKIINLENLIYLTVFLLPAYLWRFDISCLPAGMVGFHSNALDWLLFASIVWGAVLYGNKKSLQLFLKEKQLLIFSAGLIVLGLLISVLLNKNYSVGFGIIKSWFLLPLLFSVVARLAISEERRKNIFLAYYCSAFFVALIALGYFFANELTYDSRLQGFFNSPNYLAMYLAPTIFVFYALQKDFQRKKQIFVLASGMIIFWALYLTYSYASWLAIVMALILVLVINKKLNWKKASLGVVLFLSLVFLQMDKQKFSDLAGLTERSSLSSRRMIWQSTGKILADNWLWGIGAGNFQEKYLEYQKHFPPYLEWAVPHPHNLYLTVWLYGGMFGFLGFLALISFWFFGIREEQKKSQLKMIGLGIVFYVLLHGLVDTTYFKNDLAVIFWLSFSLL